MHVLKLLTSSSLAVNVMSRYTTPLSVYLIAMSLVIDVFLLLVSENAGSTPIEFMAASAYFCEGKAIEVDLKDI